MKKFAVFVEGSTEQEFVIRLLKDLAGSKQLQFEIYDQHRGYLQLKSFAHPEENPEWMVLIANCHNDEQVKTQIIDNYHLTPYFIQDFMVFMPLDICLAFQKFC